MTISAKDVAALREKTGAGMMDCKKALTAAEGDIEKAVVILREKGLSRVRKRGEKSANEGRIIACISDDSKIGVLLELNCETDFVARTDEFADFGARLCAALAEGNPSPETWTEIQVDGGKAGLMLKELSAKLGERLEMRRFVRFQSDNGLLDSYIHGGGTLGVMLEVRIDGGSAEAQPVVHNLAMQIAASNPSAVCREEVPSEEIEKELEIYRAQARNEGKPENIIDRIAEGKLGKFYQEICLLEQPFIKEPKIKVSDYLKQAEKENAVKVSPIRFARFTLGGV